MIFKRGTSWLAVVFLALLAACASYVVKHPRVTAPRTEASEALAALPSPTPVQVAHIVDGDTFHVFVTLRTGERVRAPVRIRGLDTPEIHGACDSEIRAARDASQGLRELLASGDVLLSEISSDKYERVLARVFVRRGGALLDVAEVMVNEGYGRAYEGRKRTGWC